MKIKLYPLIFALMAPAAYCDDAPETTSATMHVTLNVLKSCAVAVNDLNFGSHESSHTGAIDASSVMTVTCTKDTPYKITAAGTNDDSSGSFELIADNAATVPYKLFTDEAGSEQITPQAPVEGHTGTGDPEIIPMYGKIDADALTHVPAGHYTDDVTLTVSY